jgi:hypothetical protein
VAPGQLPNQTLLHKIHFITFITPSQPQVVMLRCQTVNKPTTQSSLQISSNNRDTPGKLTSITPRNTAGRNPPWNSISKTLQLIHRPTITSEKPTGIRKDQDTFQQL